MCLKKLIHKPDLIIGYTTRKHLLLDLDDTTIDKARGLVELIFEEWPEVGDVLLVKSSEGIDAIYTKYDNYQRPYHKRDRLNIHLVFDNLIGYNKACRICEVLAGIHVINKGYSEIRKFRGDLTLRISPKVNRSGTQPYPRIFWRKINPYNNKKGGYIDQYKKLLGFSRALFLPNLDPKHKTNNGCYCTDHGA